MKFYILFLKGLGNFPVWSVQPTFISGSWNFFHILADPLIGKRKNEMGERCILLAEVKDSLGLDRRSKPIQLRVTKRA